jgi:hypothetical protein
MREVVHLGTEHVARAAGKEPDEPLELKFVQFRLPENDIVGFVEYKSQLQQHLSEIPGTDAGLVTVQNIPEQKNREKQQKISPLPPARHHAQRILRRQGVPQKLQSVKQQNRRKSQRNEPNKFPDCMRIFRIDKPLHRHKFPGENQIRPDQSQPTQAPINSFRISLL